MSTYEVGTLAVATVRGVEGVRVFATLTNKDGILWRHKEIRGRWASHDFDVTDIRPLVVVDLPGITGAEVASHLRQKGRPGYCVCNMIADQIEAQSKPPCIPEPGLWGVVEAAYNVPENRREFVHWPDGLWRSRGIVGLTWDGLIDPTLIREGVAS